MALRVRRNGVDLAWTSQSAPGGSTTVAGGLVWSLAEPGNLLGLAPGSGRVVVSLTCVPAERYEAPAAGEGLLVVAGTSRVEAFEGASGYLRP